VAGDVQSAYAVFTVDTSVTGPNFFQDLVVSGVTWTPKAFTIEALNPTALDTPTTTICESIGVCDGTSQYAHVEVISDNIASTRAHRVAGDVGCVILGIPGASIPTTDSVAVFSSFVTGGVRLQWNIPDGTDLIPGAPSVAHTLRLTIYGGDDYNALAFNSELNATEGGTVTIPTTFKVSAGEFVAAETTKTGSVNKWSQWSLSSRGVFVHQGQTTIKQWSSTRFVVNNLSALNARCQQVNDRAFALTNNGLDTRSGGEVTAVGATGITITSRDLDTTNKEFFGLLHGFDDREVDAGEISTPALPSGSMGVTLGWEPQILKMRGALEDTSGDQFSNTNTQTGQNYWVADGTTVSQFASCPRDASANNLSRSIVSNSLTCSWHDGSDIENIIRLNTPVFDATGWVSNPTHAATLSTVRYWHWWAVEAPPSTAGLLGTLSTTESSDSSTFDGSIAIDGVLSATELVDTASFTAGFDVDGVLSAIELEDAATFTASVVTNVIGTLSATEPADVADMSGAIELLGVLTAVESADVALFGGTIVTGLAGTLSAVELEDTAVLPASVDVLGMMSVTELGDTAVLTATFQSALAGTLSAVEASDVASFTGAIDVAGVLAVTEAADVASLPATVELTGNELLESINDKVCELWQLAGLEAGNPMTVTPITRTTQNGEIDLTLSGDGVSTKTVTRN
jgi:hypothetical protein